MINFRKTMVGVLCALGSTFSFAQEKHFDGCGFDPHGAHADEDKIEQLEDSFNQFLKRKSSKNPSNLKVTAGGTYTLPVVVHVVHNNGPENISSAQVNTAIDQLNAAFANMGYYDQGTGTDIEVQFCLAARTPGETSTDGITRTVSPLTYVDKATDDQNLKNLVQWDPTEYVNIWVVDEIVSGPKTGVAGYAYFPTSHGQPWDGIVCEAAYFGTTDANTSVLIHEMGHYLGLYHTFQGGCTNNDCMVDGDMVCDTPPDNSTGYIACGDTYNSCHTDEDDISANNPFRSVSLGGLGDQPDMHINYMDYSDVNCYSAFTEGQKERMRFLLTTARASLLDSKGCVDPCTATITADFTSGSSIHVGDLVTFTNSSVGGTNYQWLIDGTPIANTQDLTYTFTTEGVYEVALIVDNIDPNCQETVVKNIQVTCPITAGYTVSATTVNPGQPVTFTNNSVGATSYTWYLNGTAVATSTDFTYTPALPGTFDVYVEASNGVCEVNSFETVITSKVGGLPQTGLPVWPQAVRGNVPLQVVDWRSQPVETSEIPGTSVNGGQTGAAFSECGDLLFYTFHTGSGQQNNLFIYTADGTPLLSDVTPNGPGLNAVKGGQEVQVVPVPGEEDRWYIIYKMWTTDVGAPASNGAYTPANWMYSIVEYEEGSPLTVVVRDQPLQDNLGNSYTYTDGAAVSRTVNGDPSRHYLYLSRRGSGQNFISLDRFIIDNTGITFDANTGNVTATWFGLTIAGSPVELSPTEDNIAVVTRNQTANFTDIVVFDAAAFDNTTARIISAGDLVLQSDGNPNDQSSILPMTGTVSQIGANTSYPLRFLVNLEKKIAGVEFSPNGRFLYFISGGYVSGGSTNLTYLGQIDLAQSPLEVRLQIQKTPGAYSPTSGGGCALSSCEPTYQAISGIESSYDGNLYFIKRNLGTLFVIPDPDNFMPQNLVPSDIDLSTPSEPNIDLIQGRTAALPDQIDGFNYLNGSKTRVSVNFSTLGCNGQCDENANYTVEVLTKSGDVVQTLLVDNCDEVLNFCVDNGITLYDISVPAYGLFFADAIINTQVNYPSGQTAFVVNTTNGCVEICDNDIDDDGDGLMDENDPDCNCGLVLDLGPDVDICDNGEIVQLDAGPGFVSYLWQDGFDGQVYSAWGEGIYSVTVEDECGNVYTDEVLVNEISEPFTYSEDLTYCAPDAVIVTKEEVVDLTIEPATGYTIIDESNVSFAPDVTTMYTITAILATGCLVTDEFTVTVDETCGESTCQVTASDDVTICEGESTTLSATTDNCEGSSSCFPEVLPVVDCSACNRSIAGNGWESVNAGETVCVTAGTSFTGGLNLNGGTLIICGEIDPSNVNYNSGDVVVIGEAHFGNINMNNLGSSMLNYGTMTLDNVTFNGTFENHGVASVSYDFNINSPQATFVNTGEFTVDQSFNINAFSTNMGSIFVGNSMRNNGGATFLNECTIEIVQNFHNNDLFTNYGTVSAGGTTFLNGGSQYVAEEGSVLSTKDMHLNGEIAGSNAGCAKVEVSGNSTINSGAVVYGNVDYCDANGIETFNITWGAGVTTNCNCTAGGSSSLSYTWSPATGLSSTSVPGPVATPIVTTVYEVTVVDATGATTTDQVTVTVEDCDDDVDDNDGTAGTFLAPNPFSGGSMLTIPSNLPNVYWAGVRVVNMLGNEVYRNDYFPINNSVSFGWEFQPGTYTLLVQIGNEMFTEVFIKL